MVEIEKITHSPPFLPTFLSYMPILSGEICLYTTPMHPLPTMLRVLDMPWVMAIFWRGTNINEVFQKD